MFIHSSVDGYLDCFHLLAIVNNAAMNIGVQVSESLLSIPLGVYPGVELLDRNSTFSFLKNHQTIFHSSYAILHSY